MADDDDLVDQLREELEDMQGKYEDQIDELTAEFEDKVEAANDRARRRVGCPSVLLLPASRWSSIDAR